MNKIRVAICDDHAILREGLRLLLSRQPNIEVVAEASTGEEAKRIAEEISPDVIIMDISLPDINGILVTRIITQIDPRIGILILTMYNDREYLLSALRAGAKGYLIKEGTIDEVIQAITSVYRHQIFIDKKFPPDVVNNTLLLLKDKENIENDDILTPREKEVLALIAEGKSNKEIAAYLNLSVKTVDVHRSNIMRKLNTHDAISLIRKAVQKGWIKLK